MNVIVPVLDLVLTVYWLVLMTRVVMSWMRIDPYSGFGNFIYSITEPVLRPIRNFLPQSGPLDFSVLIAILVIVVLQRILRTL